MMNSMIDIRVHKSKEILNMFAIKISKRSSDDDQIKPPFSHPSERNNGIFYCALAHLYYFSPHNSLKQSTL